MEKYNLVTKNKSLTPNYKIDDKSIYFDIYISAGKEVCIIGELDNNYLCWCSITSLSERETNVQIFQHLLNLNPNIISNKTSALGARFQEVRNWHRFRIEKRHYKNGEYLYYSAGTQIFCGENTNKENVFESEMNSFYRAELAKCEYRLIDRSYLKILEKYKKILTAKQHFEYYVEMKPLISILETESYLKLCPNEKISGLYLECMKECSNLYNSYMTAVR
ncbi:hypothetical protein QNH39_04295 [Neobacillus novalis]|uniref:Uncharacterized protein n=1 Tax=Neobacillus novalis TaxID=220687 RepID=A0AA95MNQ3_9BACI|nr:hypothetical protein [Neobacillus novalis]WHY87091.1 hypothetical protein QNH39_04295 [Neobacillus novalis]